MQLTLQEQLGHRLMVGFHGLEAPDYLLRWLAEGRVGGVILFARNVASPSQLADLSASLHAAAKYPILISIDQEGGTVARLRQGFTESPGAMALGAAGDEALAEEVAAMMAAEMRALGINWVLAPAIDITHDISNPTTGTRSLGMDKDKVSRLAAAQVRGFQKMGVAASAKHFPGLGNTPVDTHVALAVIDGRLDYLWENDLLPFRAAVDAGTATVMVSHVKFTELDADHPATLSPAIITRLLREEIGFTGVTCTDCMEMKAIASHYGAGESAVLAMLAGADIVLFSHSFAEGNPLSEEVFGALENAVSSGRLAQPQMDAALERILALRQSYRISDLPQPDLIRSPAHLEVAQRAARRGLVLLQDNPALFPLPSGQRIGVVEFASVLESEVMEAGGRTGFGTLLHQAAPHIQHVALRSTENDPQKLAAVQELAHKTDLLILATRNAHIIPEQLAKAQPLMDSAAQVLLLPLRNPYDVDVLPGADAILCTCGDSTPSLEAAVDALLGKFTPTGKLPVQVEVAE